MERVGHGWGRGEAEGPWKGSGWGGNTRETWQEVPEEGLQKAQHGVLYSLALSVYDPCGFYMKLEKGSTKETKGWQ